jgi:hypothetical protein
MVSARYTPMVSGTCPRGSIRRTAKRLRNGCETERSNLDPRIGLTLAREQFLKRLPNGQRNGRKRPALNVPNGSEDNEYGDACAGHVEHAPEDGGECSVACGLRVPIERAVRLHRRKHGLSVCSRVRRLLHEARSNICESRGELCAPSSLPPSWSTETARLSPGEFVLLFSHRLLERQSACAAYRSIMYYTFSTNYSCVTLFESLGVLV